MTVVSVWLPSDVLLSAYCFTGVSLTLDVGYLFIKVQRLLLTVDVGCLLMAAATDLEHRVSPLGCSPLPVDGQLRAKAGFK